MNTLFRWVGLGAWVLSSGATWAAGMDLTSYQGDFVLTYDDANHHEQKPASLQLSTDPHSGVQSLSFWVGNQKEWFDLVSNPKTGFIDAHVVLGGSGVCDSDHARRVRRTVNSVYYDCRSYPDLAKPITGVEVRALDADRLEMIFSSSKCLGNSGHIGTGCWFYGRMEADFRMLFTRYQP